MRSPPVPPSRAPLCRSKASTSPPSSGGEINPNPGSPSPKLGKGAIQPSPVGSGCRFENRCALSNRGRLNDILLTAFSFRSVRQFSFTLFRRPYSCLLLTPTLRTYGRGAAPALLERSSINATLASPFWRKGLTRKPLDLRTPFLSFVCPKGKLIVHPAPSIVH